MDQFVAGGRRFGAAAAVLAALVFCYQLRAEDPNAGRARILSAAHSTTLDDDSVAPFYLKLDVELFDSKGKSIGPASAEAWWAQGGLEKRVYTTPAGRYAELSTADQILRSPGAPYPPKVLDFMLDQVLHPLPSASWMEKLKPELRPTKFGSVPLDCVLMDTKSFGSSLPYNYCFDPGQDSLRLEVVYGTWFVFRNSVGKFSDKYVPLDIVIRNGNALLAKGHISALTSRRISPDEVSREGLTQTFARPGSGSWEKGVTRHEVAPKFPDSAKVQHRSGTVFLRAIVGTDGHLTNIEAIPGPDEDFVRSAIEAVREWVWPRYLVGGVPKPIGTTVAVNFLIAPR